MPRRTCFSTCRLLLLIFLLASVIPIAWLAIPCPLADNDPTAYSTHLLKSGKTVTRVYETDAFYPYYITDDYGYVASDLDDEEVFTSWNAPYLALYFSLYMSQFSTRTARDVIGLQINNATIYLSPLLTSSSSQASSSELYNITAPVDYGEGIVLPWFPPADRVLLQHSVDPHAYNATIPIRITATTTQSPNSTDTTNTTTIEIHPIKAPAPPDSHPSNNQSSAPLLRLIFTSAFTPASSPEDYSYDIHRLLSATPPFFPASSSPSKTYILRQLMLDSMAPSFLYLTSTYGHIIVWIMETLALAIYWTFTGGYIGILVWCFVWMFIGRPTLERCLSWCNGSRMRESGVWSRRIERVCGRLTVVRQRHMDQRGELAVWWICAAIFGRAGTEEAVIVGDEWDRNRRKAEDGNEVQCDASGKGLGDIRKYLVDRRPQKDVESGL